MGKVRVSAKAIIIRDGKVLLTKNQDSEGIYYMLPGGGQENGERIDQALQRECLEEIGAHIQVKELGFVRDYIARNHQKTTEIPDQFHQIELIFYAELLPNEEPRPGTSMDNSQIGSAWLDLDKTNEVRIYPKELFSYICSDSIKPLPVYLGDIN
ncbi:MAG: NUDIX domain-containing protein [Saprospiraceae bacterium]|nr:NUDIX domain-containing protein [Saprospiraceae bacterium]